MAEDSSAAAGQPRLSAPAPARAAEDRTGCRRSALKRALPGPPRQLRRERHAPRRDPVAPARSGQHPFAMGPLERGRQAVWQLARTNGQHHQDRLQPAVGAVARPVARRTRSRPSGRHPARARGRRRGEPRQDLADRAMAAMALVLERHPRPSAALPARKTSASSAVAVHRVRRAVPAPGPRRTRPTHRGRRRTGGRARVPMPLPRARGALGPRTAARRSLRSRVLPIPGSPASSIAPGWPRSSSSRIRSSEPSSFTPMRCPVTSVGSSCSARSGGAGKP